MTTLARRSFRKLRHILDKPYTWLEVKETGDALREGLTHRDRSIFLEMRHYFDGDDLTVYDIGASYGDYTMALAKVAKVGRIYAFEPLPDVYLALERRTARFPHVRCLNMAIGDEKGTVPSHENSFNYSSSMLPMEDLHKAEFPRTSESREIMVEVERSDEVVAQQQLLPPDLVKIDVRGFEDRVLRGGESTIRSARYYMLEMSLCSLYAGGLLFDDIYTFMKKLGFTLVSVADRIQGQTSGRVLQIDGIFRRDSA